MNKKAYTLPDKLKEVVGQFPDKVVLQVKEGSEYISYTYKEFYKIVQTIAHFLMSMGIQKGDKVAIVFENRPEWGAVYFGIVFTGAIAVPLDLQSNREEIKYLLRDSGSRMLFSSYKSLSLFSGLTNELESLEKIIVLDYEKTSKEIIPFSRVVTTISEATSEENIPIVKAEDVASIVYTSGTTGGPKGVILTHDNFCSNFEGVDRLKLISSSDNILSILPLHHTFPFTVTLIIPIFCGATITYIKTLKSDELLECMRETGVTILVGVPQLFYMFFKHIADELAKINLFIRIPLLGFIEMLSFVRKFSRVNVLKPVLSKIHSSFGKKLRFFVSGGAPLNEDAARFLTKIGFTIIEGYGLTETSPIVSLNPLKKQKIGSVGKVIHNVEVRIDSPDKDGIGEIIIKGPNVMGGYYRRDEETRAVLKNDWFYSGDLGYLDAEGYLYITGRKKEIIVLASGKNISPVEVESHYAVSPFIKELCILGLGKHEDESLGAVLVPDFDHIRKVNEINIYAAVKWELETLSKQLPAYRRITDFIITNENLPRTRLGKIKRFEIRNKYLDKFKGIKLERPEDGLPKSEEDLRILQTEVAKKIVEILARGLKIKRKIRLDDHLELDFGVDSLGRVELMGDIEKEFNITLPEALMAGVYTVKELIFLIERLVAEGIVKGEQVLSSQVAEDLWTEILRREPPLDIIKKIDLPYKRILRLSTILIRTGLYIIFKIIWRIRIVDIGNLPDDRTFILCPNHGSYLDGFIIAGSLPLSFKKDMYFLGQRAYFEGAILKRLTKLIRVIPIDPATNLVKTMQTYSYLLDKGKAACIFPEGTRSIDGEVKEFKKGVGILAKELQVPLVPVYISGSYESWPRTKRFPKPHAITVVFGESSNVDELIKIGSRLGAEDEYGAVVLGIREKVIELKNRLKENKG